MKKKKQSMSLVLKVFSNFYHFYTPLIIILRMPAQDKRDINVSANPQASPKRARTASPEPSTAAPPSPPPPLLNPRDSASVTPHARTASPAIINDDDDSDSPPPSPLFNPQASASVTPHARTASPAIINGDDDSDPPPPPLLNPQASASVAPRASTASPTIITDDDNPDGSENEKAAAWFVFLLLPSVLKLVHGVSGA